VHENNWTCRWRGAWRTMQCRGRRRTAVANNWSLHHECYWEALLILSSSFWESCKGMETHYKQPRSLAMHRTQSVENAQLWAPNFWRDAVSLEVEALMWHAEVMQNLGGFRTWENAFLFKTCYHTPMPSCTYLNHIFSDTLRLTTYGLCDVMPCRMVNRYDHFHEYGGVRLARNNDICLSNCTR
jgi:hypothetical protein